MTARTLAEDFHWLTDGCGRVWIMERYPSPGDNALLYRTWPESEAPDFCFEPEPEPVPTPPKFQVGQWVMLEGVVAGPVLARWWDKDTSCWRYRCRCFVNGKEEEFESIECFLTSSPPVLTDEQRTIQPGDTVRVIDVPVNAHGVPIIPIDGDKGKVAKVAALYLDGDGLVSCGFENWAGDYYLHNLELVEKGGQP